MRLRIAYLVISISLTAIGGAVAQTTSLTGDWTGESICFGNNPSCHDEKVVYHISIDTADSTKVKIAADKIVDGKPEWMGDVYLKYDPAKQTLTGDLESSRFHGVWEFSIKGNIIEGGLYILPDRGGGKKTREKKNKRRKKKQPIPNPRAGLLEKKSPPADDKSDDKSLGRMTIAKEWHGDLE